MADADAVPPPAVLRLADLVPSLGPGAWVAPGAIVVGDVRLGARTNVWYGSVLRADNEYIEIGEDCNLQDGCVLHADPGLPVVMGDRVSVGHRAIVHGAVLESDTLVGMGAVVLNGVRVGTGSLVAAGAVVREGTQIPPNSMAAGVPAVVRRGVSDVEREMIARIPPGYVARAERHRAASPADSATSG